MIEKSKIRTHHLLWKSIHCNNTRLTDDLHIQSRRMYACSVCLDVAKDIYNHKTDWTLLFREYTYW